MGRLLLCVFACALAATAAVHAVPATNRESAKGDRRDEIVCRRFIRTGSLIDGYRTCKTRADWDREHENLQHLDVSNSCRAPPPAGCEPVDARPPR